MYRFLADNLNPFTLTLGLVGVALVQVWRKRKSETPNRSLAALGATFLLLVAICTPAVAHLALGSLEWRYPPQDERPPSADAIVVLAGGIRRPDAVRTRTELGRFTLYRCQHAARLYHQRDPCPVILSGGKVTGNETGPSAARAMADYLITLGVPERDLILEERSRTTYENAVETGKLLSDREIDQIVLVTDGTHLLRSQRCFDALGIESIPHGTHYDATSFGWHVSDFIPSPGAARDINRAYHEWMGIVYYWVTGRL